MSAHTPGPWIHATDVGQVGSVETPDGLVVAQTQALVRDYDRQERNANARLIAAAPELLDALSSIRTRMHEAIAAGCTAQEAYDSFYSAVVDEAIANATGEAP